MLELLELLELLLFELLISVELLSVSETLELLETLELSTELETPELCTELLVVKELTALELCVEEDVKLASTLITVAPEVSDAVLHPVRAAHIISDSAAAKNLDLPFIEHHSILFQLVLNDRARVCRAMTDLGIVAVKAVVVDNGGFGCGLFLRVHRVADTHDLSRNSE